MCDRWEDADDDIESTARRGRVARLGIAGFVAGALVVQQPQQQGSTLSIQHTDEHVVIVNSKREQRAAAAAATATAAAAAQAQVLPRPPVPPGAVAPPPGTMLQVHKAGSVVQQIQLMQPLTLFGRLPCNDIVGDHASISRQHAAIFVRHKQHQQQLRKATAAGPLEVMVWDLGSAHGTFVQGRRISKGQQYALASGDAIQFGASTRSYTVQLGHTSPAAVAADAASDKAATKKRARVKFADDDEDGPTAAAGAASTDAKKCKLEQVVGYSTGGSFTPKVGPQAVASGNEQGKFAHLLDSKVIIKPAIRSQKQQEHQQQNDSSNTEKQQQTEQQHYQHAGAAPLRQQEHAEEQDHLRWPDNSSSPTADAAEFPAAVANTTAADVPAAEFAAAADGSAVDAVDAQSSSKVNGGVVRTWSGSAASLLIPPQLARQRSMTAAQQDQNVHPKTKQQQALSPASVVSSLYGQLPATKPAGHQAVQ